MDGDRIVAIKKMAAGNDTVGEMWTETKIFSKDDRLETVMDWVKGSRTDVILTIPDNSY